MATIVREAIDRGLPSTHARRRGAAEAFLAAALLPVPDVPELLAELAELRGQRG